MKTGRTAQLSDAAATQACLERPVTPCTLRLPPSGLTVASVHGRRNDIWSSKRRAAVEPLDWLETLGLAGEEFRSGNLRAMRVKSTMSRAAW